MKATIDHLPLKQTNTLKYKRTFKKKKQEYFTTKLYRPDRYILNIVKTVNLDEITYLLHSERAVSFQRELHPHTLLIGCDFVTSFFSVSETAPYTHKSSLFVMVSKSKVDIVEFTRSIP